MKNKIIIFLLSFIAVIFNIQVSAMLRSKLVSMVRAPALVYTRTMSMNAASSQSNFFQNRFFSSKKPKLPASNMEFVKKARPVADGLLPVFPKVATGVYGDIPTRATVHGAINTIINHLDKNKRNEMRTLFKGAINDNIRRAMQLQLLLPYDQVCAILIKEMGHDKGTNAASQSKDLLIKNGFWKAKAESIAEARLSKNHLQNHDQDISYTFGQGNVVRESQSIDKLANVYEQNSTAIEDQIPQENRTKSGSSLLRTNNVETANNFLKIKEIAKPLQSINAVPLDNVSQTTNQCMSCNALSSCKINLGQNCTPNNSNASSCQTSPDCMQKLMRYPAGILAGMFGLLGLQAYYMNEKKK